MENVKKLVLSSFTGIAEQSFHFKVDLYVLSYYAILESFTFIAYLKFFFYLRFFREAPILREGCLLFGKS